MGYPIYNHMGNVNLFECIKVIANSTENYLGSGDNLGFSAADIYDGMRLGARVKAGKFLRKEEIEAAKGFIFKYQSQLPRLYSDDSEAQKQAFLNYINGKDLYPYKTNHEEYESYLTISNNRKHLLIYVLDHTLQKTIWNELKDYHKVLFGERRIYVRYEKEYQYNYLSLKFNTTRWKITFTDEMRRQLIDFCRAKDILINPLVFKRLSKEEIFLTRHKNVCRIRNAVRDGVSGTYFVLNMDEPITGVAEVIKSSFESYSCRKEDDYDWYILATETNTHKMKNFVVENSFICDNKARAFLFN